MNIRALIFTHAPDYPLAVVAATQLLHHGIETILCIDQKEETEPEWPLVRRTTFERSGNLNGVEAVSGIIDLLEEYGKGMDWIMKVDSDVIIFSIDWLLVPGGIGWKPKMIGHTYPPMRGEKGIYGAVYAIQPSILPEMRRRLLLRGEQRQRAEDMIMGLLGHGFLHRHRFGGGKGHLRFWRHDEDASVSPVEAMKRWQIVGVQRVPGADSPFGREQVLAKMEELHRGWVSQKQSGPEVSLKKKAG